MIFELIDEKYISSFQIFLNSSMSNYEDQVTLKKIGLSYIEKLDNEEEILDDTNWPKLCMLDLNNWICILDDFYGLYNILSLNSKRELIFGKLSEEFHEIIIIGTFSEVIDEFLFEYYKNGQLKRRIEIERENFEDKVNIKKIGIGKTLEELPPVLDFQKQDFYIESILSNFRIFLDRDISKGRFYKVK